MRLNITDLVPKETTFTLSNLKKEDGSLVIFTLRKWSLLVRSWAVEKYSTNGLESIFKENKIQEVADIAWFMLKEKSYFEERSVGYANAQESFMDSINSIDDQINVLNALLGAVGIGEPERKALTEGAEAPKIQAPKTQKKTGAKSTTR